MTNTKRAASGCLLACLLLSGCGRSDEIRREEFAGKEQVAMYKAAVALLANLSESMFLFRNGDSNIVGFASKGEKGFMVGNSVNMNLLTTCEFYESVTIQGDSIRFDNMSGEATGKLDGPDLTLTGMSHAANCGMGASIDGTFSRFAEIVFDRIGGKLTVKHVYKLN